MDNKTETVEVRKVSRSASLRVLWMLVLGAIVMPSLGRAVERWERTYGFGGILDASGNAVEQMQDGGYVAAGSVRCSLLLVRTDSFGDTLWTRAYQPTGACSVTAYALAPTSDGGILTVGSMSDGSHRWGYWLKTDGHGDSMWAIAGSCDSSGAAQLFSLTRTHNGSYLAVGEQEIGSTTSHVLGVCRRTHKPLNEKQIRESKSYGCTTFPSLFSCRGFPDASDHS